MGSGGPWLIARTLCLPAWGTLLVGDWMVTRQVAATSADARAAFVLVGIPLVEATRLAGHVRIRYGWGALLVIVGPLVIGMLLALWEIAWLVRARERRDGRRAR